MNEKNSCGWVSVLLFDLISFGQCLDQGMKSDVHPDAGCRLVQIESRADSQIHRHHVGFHYILFLLQTLTELRRLRRLSLQPKQQPFQSISILEVSTFRIL
jgi:hypothetical protein